MITSTCKDCKKRHPGCHGHCPEYLKFRAELDAYNKKRREQIMLEMLSRPERKKRRK